MSRRLGIYGGTFNPIHNGHLIVAQNALEYFNLDVILFVPSNVSYLKDNVTEVCHRLKMTELAISGNTSFELSRVEIDRGGDSYTFETLEELSKQYPGDELFFIMGADSFDYLGNWKRPDLIFKKATIIVAERDGFDTIALSSKQKEYEQLYDAKVLFLPKKQFDISSSEIRERVRQKKTIDYFVPSDVAKYIYDNNLFSEETANDL